MSRFLPEWRAAPLPAAACVAARAAGTSRDPRALDRAFDLLQRSLSLGSGRNARDDPDLAALGFVFEGRSYKVTISLGVASTQGSQAPAPLDLIRRADERLYRAKGGGRNRVVACTDATP